MQILLLLGKRFDGSDTNKTVRRSRDLAVKRFLEEVNNLRKSKYGMTDFCGKYQMAPEGSLEEAEEWEELARNSLAEMDQSDLESDSE